MCERSSLRQFRNDLSKSAFSRHKMYRKSSTILRALDFRWDFLRQAANQSAAVSSVKDECNLPDICATNPNGRKFHGVVLGFYEKVTSTEQIKLTQAAEQFDQKVNGQLLKFIQEARLTGSIGTHKLVHSIAGDFDAVAVVGLGRKDCGFDRVECINRNMENVRIAAAVGTKALKRQNCTKICVDDMNFAEQAAEGSVLSLWKYKKDLCDDEEGNRPNLKLFGSGDVNSWTRGIFRAEAQNIVRNLCEMPSNHLTPIEFGQRAIEILCPCGVTVEVHEEDWILSQQMDATIAVASTSIERPVFLEINYRGTNADDKPIVLVGKGLTFDTGGLSLKQADSLHEMRASMVGAAVTIATVRAIAQLQIPINVTALIPVCEHVTSGMPVRPSDVIRLPNGKTVAIDDSTNVGMLTTADAILYGQCNYKPRAIISVGSLDNCVKDTFGDAVTPVFTNSSNLWSEIRECGAYSGDRVWKMPMWDYHMEKITNSPSADHTYVGTGNARCGKLASFLRGIAMNDEFCHVEVHGTGFLNGNDDQFPYLEQNHMSGRPTRALIQLLIQMSSIEANKNKN